MTYNNIEKTKELFDSGIELIYDANDIAGNVLYIEGTKCYIQVGKDEIFINLDECTENDFKISKQK